jgi:hypothetical protein
MRNPSTGWLAAPLCIAILAAPSIAATEDTDIPGAPHLLPEDTLAYIRLDSADDFRTDMANSSLGQMLSDPRMKPFVGEVTQLVTDVFQIVVEFEKYFAPSGSFGYDEPSGMHLGSFTLRAMQ